MKRIISIILLVFISLILTGCKDNDPDPIYDDVVFAIIGETDLTIAQGEDYVERGYLAKDGSKDISSYVVIQGSVNINIAGTYKVIYKLDYEGRVTELERTITVVYTNLDCDDVTTTELQECYKNWSSYLHTVVTLKIYINNSVVLSSDDVFEEIESLLSFYNDISDKYKLYDGVTNIKTINDNPTETHVISEELFDLLEFSLTHQAEVNDIFNIALGPVIKVWHNYREDCNNLNICAIPTLTELQEQNAFTDPSKIVMDRDNLTITMDANMSLDLGGVSKGYISGIIIEYLETLELHGYLLNNGESNISIGGEHPTRTEPANRSGDFLIAVTDPTNVLPYYATVFLSDGDQLVTSGDYQQYFTVDGEIYHHIISGDSLFPDRNSRSVSIITSDPGLADLYSTAIFLMTIEDGIEFVDSVFGLEAIWYGLDGTIHFSENFEINYLGATYK